MGLEPNNTSLSTQLARGFRYFCDRRVGYLIARLSTNSSIRNVLCLGSERGLLQYRATHDMRPRSSSVGFTFHLPLLLRCRQRLNNAEPVGFEPTEALTPHSLSKRAHSTGLCDSSMWTETQSGPFFEADVSARTPSDCVHLTEVRLSRCSCGSGGI